MPWTRFAPAVVACPCLDLRVGRDEIRWRHGVEELPGAEGHHRFMTLADATHAGGRGFPPFLHREEAVGVDVEWKRLPLGGTKTVVVRQRAKAGMLTLAALASPRIGEMIGCRIEGTGCQGGLFAGCDQEMHGPIEVGASKRARGQSAGQSPDRPREACDRGPAANRAAAHGRRPDSSGRYRSGAKRGHLAPRGPGFGLDGASNPFARTRFLARSIRLVCGETPFTP